MSAPPIHPAPSSVPASPLAASFHATPFPRPGSRHGGSAAAGSSGKNGRSAFTAEMRDRQARGKDPYETALNSAEMIALQQQQMQAGRRLSGMRLPTAGGSGSHIPGFGPLNWRPFEQMQQNKSKWDEFATAEWRRHAEVVLDSPELLMMYAQSTGDSIPATRLQFTRIMCGYDDDSGPYAAAGGSVNEMYPRVSHPSGAGVNSAFGSRSSSGKRKLPNWT